MQLPSWTRVQAMEALPTVCTRSDLSSRPVFVARFDSRTGTDDDRADILGGRGPDTGQDLTACPLSPKPVLVAGKSLYTPGM